MLITKEGVIIRSSVAEVRNTGRNAQGVRLVNLDANDIVCAVARVIPEDKAVTVDGTAVVVDGDGSVNGAADGADRLPTDVIEQLGDGDA